MTGAGELSARAVPVRRFEAGRILEHDPDIVAIEEPLDIQIGFTDGTRHFRTLSITMRTPGQDRELAAGFLFTEGIVRCQSDVAAILDKRNVVRVELAPHVPIDWPSLERHVFTSSSCGVCGKTSIEAVHRRLPQIVHDDLVISPEVLSSLPGTLRRAQIAFETTGGVHGAALFDRWGNLLEAQEDVGRHNALDKLIGSSFLNGRLPLAGHVLLVSGRAGFELVHKAVAAGIPVMAAVGAPSSLAVDLAEDAGLTLAGFVRDGRFNLYSGTSRVRGEA